MYNDGGVTDNLFTGYYDSVAEEYVTPSAPQNFVIRFPTWYLSAIDGDFTTEGITISSEIGQSDDITIGNAPAKVLTATMLNPNGTMENAPWGMGKAYIGVATAETTADTQTGLNPHIYYNAKHFGIQANGTLYANGVTYAAGGEPKAVVVMSGGDTGYFYTSTGAWLFNGTSFVVAQSNPYLEGKYAAMTEPIGYVLDSNLVPAIVNDLANDTKTTYTYIPVGVYDFSNVDAYGVTFGIEAYDKMVQFDADATDWVASLDFTLPKTISTLISELMTKMGFTATISGSAVNTTLSFSDNPIVAYSVTYRQILKQLAEAIGCNARISRDGTKVEFHTYSSTSVSTIPVDIIVSNSRTKARYTVPQITKTVCYDTLGANYESGSNGPTYYIAANPFFQTLDQSVTPLTNITNLLRSGIPVYYPTTITVACADPRIDSGDFVTINTTDGTLPYAVPLMRQTLTWQGMCRATYTASGNQARIVPGDLTDTNLSTTVNGRKILAGVDAKRITVLDENEDILFNADADTDEVRIAEFTVEADNFRYYHSEQSSEVPTEDDDYETKASKTGFTTQSTEWHDLSGTEYSIGKFSQVSQGEIEVTTDNQYPSDARAGTTMIGGGWVETDVHFSDQNKHIYAGISSDRDAPIYARDDHNYGESIDQIDISPTSIEFSQDGNVIKTISAVGPDIESDSGTVSRASGTSAKTVATFTLDPGVYLLCVQMNFASTSTTGRRFVNLSLSQNSTAPLTPFHRANGNGVSGGATNIGFSAPYTATQQTTLYLNTFQNSNSTLSVDWAWCYVRLA